MVYRLGMAWADDAGRQVEDLQAESPEPSLLFIDNKPEDL